jgi:hypothetical protein
LRKQVDERINARMARSIPMAKESRIKALLKARWGDRDIAREVRVDKGTVRVRRFRMFGMLLLYKKR